MEEKTIKINNLEVKCEALIEFTSLTNVLLELVKRQKDMEKKLNEHDIKINNIKKVLSSGGEGGLGWQDKENEITNILKDDDNFNININNNNLNDDDNNSDNNFNININNNNLNDDDNNSDNNFNNNNFDNNDLNNGMTKEY